MVPVVAEVADAVVEEAIEHARETWRSGSPDGAVALLCSSWASWADLVAQGIDAATPYES
jgi:hypothetical protein